MTPAAAMDTLAADARNLLRRAVQSDVNVSIVSLFTVATLREKIEAVFGAIT